MKRLLKYLLLFINFISLSYSQIEGSHIDKFLYKTGIKYVEIYRSEITEKYGDYYETELNKWIIEYGSNNKLVKQSAYSDGSLIFYYLPTFDENKKITSMTKYTSMGSSKIQYKYDNDKLVESADYNYNGYLSSKVKYKYDVNNNMIEEVFYKKDGKLNFKLVYKYNIDNNLIGASRYDVNYRDELELNSSVKYEIDSNGNIVEMPSLWWEDEKTIHKYNEDNQIIESEFYKKKFGDYIITFREKYKYKYFKDVLPSSNTINYSDIKGEPEPERQPERKPEPIIIQSKKSSSYNAIGAGFNYGFGTNGEDWNYDIMLSYLFKRNNFGYDVGIGSGKNQISFEKVGDSIMPMYADERTDIDELNSKLYKLGIYYYIYEKNNVSLFTGINYYNISVKLDKPWDWVSDGGKFSALYFSLGINLLDWISLEGGFNISRDNTIKFERIHMDPPHSEYTGIKYSNIDFKGTIYIPFGYK